VEDGGSTGRFVIFLKSQVASGTAAMSDVGTTVCEGRHYLSWLYFEMEVTLGN
jgi:hypothetical protein